MKYSLLIFISLLFIQSQSFAQLQQTNGPGVIGNSYCVYADEDVVFAAFGPELYKSTDGGDSFDQITIDDEYVGIDPRLVLRINDVFICATNQGDRIYRSTDMGETWTASWTGTPDIAGFPAAVVTGGIVKDNTFIIWGTNLYRYSTDLGLTWQSYTTLTPGSGEGLANVNGRLWVGAYNYTGYSDDDGATWTQTATNPHIGFGLSGRDFVQVGDRTYCGTSAAGNQALKYTTDNGATWVNGSNALSIISDMEYIDGVFYAYCYNGLFRSLDDGLTWEQYLNVTQPGYGGTFDIVGDILWIATANGPVRFDMTTGTSNIPTVIGGTTNWVLAGTDYLYAGTGNTVSVSSDNGDTWSIMTFPPFVSPWGSVTYASIDGNTLYLAHSVVNNAPGIFYTSDGGVTWTAMDPTLFGGNDPAIFLSYNPQIVITSEWFVINYYYSNDDGATWQQGTITAAPGSNLPASYSVNALHRVGTRLFLATNSGHAVSNDNGQTWTFVQPGFNLTQFCGWDSRVVAIENHWSGKRLHESTDGGLTWTQINGAFPTHADGRINPSAMTNVGNTIMCQNIPLDETVANPRVLYTLSENGDWTAAPSLGVLDYDITFISGTALDQFYVSTVGGGVWKNSTGVGLVEVNKQNDWKIFPNPAVNNITFINDNGRVKNYRIYSITGALCASGQITQAQQNISVDALTSGVYEFVVIDDNGIMSTQTIMKH